MMLPSAHASARPAESTASLATPPSASPSASPSAASTPPGAAPAGPAGAEPAAAEASNHDPADAAFVRGTSLLAARCDQLKAAYEHDDRRPEVVRELSDCYLIDADVWRAEAMRADADRLAAAGASDQLPAGAQGVELSALRAQWQEACRAFERSQELEPSAGAQLAAALCRIRDGKLASSRALLQGMLLQMTALAEAGEAFHVNRLALVRALLQDIERVQPRVTLQVTGDRADELAAGLAIDGQPASANQPRLLDPGLHRITASHHDRTVETSLTVAPRRSYQLTLHEEPPRSLRSWHLATWSLAGASVAAAITGGAAWWYASQRFEAFEAAGGFERDGALNCDAGVTTCHDAAGDVNRARTMRTAALLTAGGLALATASVYLITPRRPPARLYWLPQVERGQVAVSVQGGF